MTDWSAKAFDQLNIKADDILKIDFAHSEFFECRFEHCTFISTDFRDAHFNDCTFENCSILLTNIGDCRFQSVHFTGSKISGLDFTTANDFLMQLSFENCKIEGCGFSGLQLSQTQFSSCEINQCDFFGANLEESDFSFSRFDHTIFQQTDLRKANFKNAEGYEINPLENKLRGATFSLPEASSMFKHIGIIIEE